jgi:hypothetical protein
MNMNIFIRHEVATLRVPRIGYCRHVPAIFEAAKTPAQYIDTKLGRIGHQLFSLASYPSSVSSISSSSLNDQYLLSIYH